MKIRQFSILYCFLVSTAVNAQQWGDYTLYSVQNTSTTYLLDTNGNVEHTWNHATTDKTGYSSYLMPNHILWRTVKTTTHLNGGGIYGRVQKVDWDGNVLWDFTYTSSTYCLHHDICPLPNGNVLLISYDVKTATEASAAGKTGNSGVWSEKIMEVKPTGTSTFEVVWEWKLWDHLIQNVDATKANYFATIEDHPELLNINYGGGMQQDWIHMNGVDYNPILDQIAFSSHFLNQWFVVDHSTTTQEAATHVGGNSGKGGDILYRYGNPTSYNVSGSTVLNVTHDVHWIPEGCPNAGRLAGFNNKGVSSSQSSIDEINVPLNGYNYDITAGQAFSPSIYDFRLPCNGYSSNMGNSHQLPNGNMLVCMATAGTIYEVDPNGTTIWTKTVSGTVPQAFRYSDCYVNGQPIEIPVITVSGQNLVASSAYSYQWYLNGQPISGATDQTYMPSQSGIYLVRISNSNSCYFQYSEDLYFDKSGTNGIQEVVNESVSISPNPSDKGIYSVSFPTINMQSFSVKVFTVSGEEIFNSENNATVDISKCNSGVYYLKVVTSGGFVYVSKLIKN